MMTLLSRAALAAAAMVLGLSAAHATYNATGNMSVHLTVLQTCTVSNITALEFGSKLASAGTADASATFTVNCGAANYYNVSLSGGSNPTGASRYMKQDSGATIRYELFTDSDRAPSHLWAINASQSALGGSDVIVYGRAYVSGATPGDYTDTVAISFTY